MTSLSFVPLSLIGESARSSRGAAAPSGPPIVLGREAVFVDLAEAGDAASRLPWSRRELGTGKVLATVVQKGRLFERAHPDVTVLRNRGRFLLVELAPDHPALAERTDEPCYAAYRVEPGTEVFRDLSPADLRIRRDPAIEAVIDRLSIATFRGTLEELTGLRTRLSTSEFYHSAAGMCRDRLEALGYRATVETFPMPGARSFNVVTAGTGAEAGAGAVLVVGHLDSVNHIDGPDGSAPGADDNGSGSAGVIAMAEALQAVRERISVRFALFGGEEQGLHGSRHLVAGLSGDERAALRAVINMDMIANLNVLPDGTTVPPGVLLEGAEVSRGVIEGLAAHAAGYTDLAVQASFNPFASDHVPFIQAGLPAVLTIEGADQANDRIHTAADTLDHIDDALAYRILRMNTAYLASLAGTCPPVELRSGRDRQPADRRTHVSRSCASVQNYFRQVDLYPALRRNQAMLESMTNAAAARSFSLEPAFPRQIPVVVHVLYRDDTDNITDGQVASQIEVLNEDFSAKNRDLGNVPEPFKDLVGDPGLEFFLANVDPAGGNTSGITRTQTSVASFGVDDGMKSDASGGKSPWDTARYLNIWVCRLSGSLLGYAQFPGGEPATDGVVITTSAFGRGGTAQAPFDLGRTTTHEVGHYLNLSHIWGESRWPTCTDSDFVDDTPNQWGPNTGKPTFPSPSCGNTLHGDMFMNYMDYVDDDTMVMFSKEQVLRMHATLEFARSRLGTLADDAPMALVAGALHGR